MSKGKKIVLFIVEGITDEISLGLVLSKIVEKDKLVRFKLINGDITTKYGTSSVNILSKITNVVKEFIEKDVYVKKDIKRIIHLVDMDGAYISDKFILHKDTTGIEYTNDCIYSINVDSIIRRNEQKTLILNKLIETNKVYTDIPYNIYFFSSNLEHVLHNEQMLNDEDKNEYAQLFEDKFAEDPKGFIDFINSPSFAVSGDYRETWNFIKRGTNSLKRYSNFQLFTNENKQID